VELALRNRGTSGGCHSAEAKPTKNLGIGLHLRIGTALVSGIVFALLAAAAQEATPATKLGDAGHEAVRAFGQGSGSNHWDLGLTKTDADISPDDRLLAITLESPRAPQKAREQIVESLEVWDYRQHTKISSTQLATYINIKPTPNAVRFSADGLLLAASDPTRLHVLEAATLKSIRLIEPPLEDGDRIYALETSPIGHLVIIAASYYTSDVLFVYDLDTGRLLFQWKSPHSVSSISWKQDGTLFAVATPFLCTRFRDTVHVFSTNPWQQLQMLTARNPVSLAFSGEQLYLVESSFCKGSAFDRHLGLEAFAIRGWERSKTLYLPHEDTHSSISFANGRLLANTGKVTTEHDWLDGTTWGINVNVQFTIWKGDTSSVEFTSPRLAVPAHRALMKSGLRLSRTGKMVLLSPQPQVFQIP
jgi:WD40 repeat protein